MKNKLMSSKNLNENIDNNPKRVLMILSTIGIDGGVQNKVMDIYRNIDRNKLQFDFFVYAKVPNSFENEINELGGKVIYPGRFREIGAYKFFSRLYETMKNGNYHAVHSHTGYNSGPILLIARFAGINIRIAHSRGTFISNKVMRWFTPLWRMLIYFNASRFLSCSEQAGKFLYGKKDFEIIPNALDINRFLNYSDLEILDLKTKMGITSDMLIIGHVGRFSYEKNHNFIIEIAKELAKKSLNFKIILVGDGELKTEIFKKVVEANLKQNFIFAGSQSNVEKYYKIFDIFLFPSIHEGFGNVAVEAQTAKNSVIASLGVSKEVDLGLNLIKFYSIEDINKWIEEITKFNNSCINVTEEDIETALNQKGFSISSVVDKYYKIYNVQ